MRRPTLLALALLAGLAASCGPKLPPSAWPYSHWAGRWGPSDLGNFERQQKACIEQSGGAGSVDENAYMQCMNANGWCSLEFHCEPPTDYPTPD